MKKKILLIEKVGEKVKKEKHDYYKKERRKKK